MTQFGRDARRKLLNMPLDVNSVLTGAGANHAPELWLERGSIAITMRENDGCLPPVPQTATERSQCALATENYRYKLQCEHEGAIPADLKLEETNFCYPHGRADSGPTLQFLVRMYSRSTQSWYGSATGLGLFRYSWGPVATQVQCPASAASGFWETPLFSLGSYQQDLERIRQFKADLARDKGERSFIFLGTMNAIANKLELETLPPDQITQVAIEREGPATASIRVRVAPHGDFIVDTKICPSTWRVLLRPPRKD